MLGHGSSVSLYNYFIKENLMATLLVTHKLKSFKRKYLIL